MGMIAAEYTGLFAGVNEDTYSSYIQNLQLKLNMVTRGDGIILNAEELLDSSYDSVRSHIIIVGSVDVPTSQSIVPNYSMSSWSGYGANVDIVAPGTHIYNPADSGEASKYNPSDNLTGWYGTSFSAPMVSGAAALVWAANPDLSAAEVKERLCGSTDVNVTDCGDASIQHPLLNVAKALGADYLESQPAVTDDATRTSRITNAQSEGQQVYTGTLRLMDMRDCLVDQGMDADSEGMGSFDTLYAVVVLDSPTDITAESGDPVANGAMVTRSFDRVCIAEKYYHDISWALPTSGPFTVNPESYAAYDGMKVTIAGTPMQFSSDVSDVPAGPSLDNVTLLSIDGVDTTVETRAQVVD